MRPLSNFGRDPRVAARDGAAAAGDVIHCRPAHRQELHAALRMVLGSNGRLADEAQVVDFLQFAVQRRLDVNDTLVAERRGRLLWAVLPVHSPGRTMLLLTPGEPPTRDAAAAAGLLADEVCARHAARGVHLAQVLLDPPDATARDVYLARGFRTMAELVYLNVTVRRRTPPPLLPRGFFWAPYSPADQARFGATILETYRDSLDCPGLNGLRDIEDVVAGHKASGDFDPSLWWLLCEQLAPAQSNDPAVPSHGAAGRNGAALAESASAPPTVESRGVLLLSRMPRTDAVELVYLGLTPAARGRGLADLLMRRALTGVVEAGRARLSLAVDAANAPAIQLYLRHGMQRVGSKVALMRVLQEGVGGRRSEVSGQTSDVRSQTSEVGGEESPAARAPTNASPGSQSTPASVPGRSTTAD